MIAPSRMNTTDSGMDRDRALVRARLRLTIHEFRARISLAVEQGGEIAVIDARVCGSSDLRLGVIGNAEAGGLQHRKIVRAVARGECVLYGEAVAIAQLGQGGELRLPAEDRLLDAARELTVFDDQRVAAVLIEPDHRGDAAGEEREAAGDETCIAAVASHRGDERASARGERDTFRDHLFD